MSQIRVSPEELRSYSSSFVSEGTAFGDVISNMTNLITGLQDVWEGQAATSFAEQFRELTPSFEACKSLIEQIAQQLDQTATAMEEFDQGVASKFGVQN